MFNIESWENPKYRKLGKHRRKEEYYFIVQDTNYTTVNILVSVLSLH